jgi:hypothetical protein
MSAQHSGFGHKVWESETCKPEPSDEETYDQEPYKNISMLKLKGSLFIPTTIHKHA